MFTLEIAAADRELEHGNHVRMGEFRCKRRLALETREEYFVFRDVTWQDLDGHAGIEDATRLRYARIIRIVVHPAVQGRGLGRRILDAILADAWTQGLDLVGASFGATQELLRFWERCGFPPAHLGTGRNAAC